MVPRAGAAVAVAFNKIFSAQRSRVSFGIAFGVESGPSPAGRATVRAAGRHPRMRIAIPLSPMSLSDAFDLADALSRRPDVGPTPCMELMAWNRAVVTAMGGRDRNALAILIRAELVPAASHALTELAATVRYAIGAPVRCPEPFLEVLFGRVEASARAMVRAGMATWAAEIRESLQPEGGGPTGPRPDREHRVMAQVFTYLQMHIDGDSRGAIGDQLVDAFRKLAGPVRAAVECVDRDELDELLPYPLQFELFETFDALSAIQRLCTVIRMAGASGPEIASPLQS